MADLNSIFSGFYQLSQTGRNRQTASEAKIDAKAALEEIRELGHRLDHMALACAAMWSLLRERMNLSEEDLPQRMTEIDMQDGQVDGRVPRQAVKCPHCGRPMARTRTRCVFCGKENTQRDPFNAAP